MPRGEVMRYRRILALPERYQKDMMSELGPVDKVGSQTARTVIQHCFLGGRVGAWRSIERAMGIDWGTVAIRTWPQVETGAG
jgi:hypothetical protein